MRLYTNYVVVIWFVMQDIIIQLLLTVACAFTMFVGILLCLGLIYYEQCLNDRYRTLINELYALILFYIILNLVYGNFVIILRIYYTSAPYYVCYSYNLVMYFFMTSVCLTLNQAMLVKYLYCCYYKMIGLLDEQFWLLYLKWFNVVVAGYTSLFVDFGNMDQAKVMSWCINEPEHTIFLPRLYDSKLPFISMTFLFTLVWHVALKVKLTKIQRAASPSQRKNMVGELLSYWSVMVFILILALSTLMGMLERNSDPPMTQLRIAVNLILGWGLPGYSFLTNHKIRTFYRRKFNVVVV